MSGFRHYIGYPTAEYRKLQGKQLAKWLDHWISQYLKLVSPKISRVDPPPPPFSQSQETLIVVFALMILPQWLKMVSKQTSPVLFHHQYG